jgi:hypothetical protein
MLPFFLTQENIMKFDKFSFLGDMLAILIYAVVIYFIVNILFKSISYVDAAILAACVRFIEWKFK